MKKLVIILSLCIFCFGAVDVSQIAASSQSTEQNLTTQQTTIQTQQSQDLNATMQKEQIQVFGAHLFSGNFRNFTQRLYNPDYKIAVGDQISLKIWGAVEYAQILVVDSQGNIFIPKVGAIKVLGVKNSQLLNVIQSSVRRVYKQNVFVYADMNAYQNVSVFVTGNVNAPGLYEGLSSDSIIQYIDKAGGINLEYGSFRDIKVLRNNKVIKEVDLYDFLLNGQMELFPYRSGDVILVGDVLNYAFVSGDVQKPFRFELADDIQNLMDLARVSGAKPIVTNAIVKTYGDNHKLDVNAYNKLEFANIRLKTGDEVLFRPEYISKDISITIRGEHDGIQSLVVKKGSTLEDISKIIKTNAMSDITSLQVFRKSVAKTQKELIAAQLKELETIALTSPSVNAEQAAIRATQAGTILEFIERAKQVEPKGQIVIENVKAYSSIVLEEGDIINVPSKNNLVIVQGEVSVPGAFVYINKENLKYYIELAGGYSDRADTSRVLVIRASGKAEKYRSSVSMKPGDSILVLPKVDTQNLQIFGMITQILYQIAVATSVVVSI
ncbi:MULTISPECIES: polysaccharide biosynthesis/export family protein [unclassified Campylobacter]|uniref:polysaccharide biosynthesis/export family protein n=1 Tax=unclassified Campylobacter TaxID=2593542 RepID=UPI0012381491|nr:MULTISPECIES: polysaccharide biosynthesis/export family protein [unclassified Campylobacter]KAA6226168.1 polysaccharide export protein [Campylobacter sp. LR185c]KAA6228116.1 polysaccharide export protein [Campylobacter sp. LR286c]KAA6231369.1 polysaccharide export protein [Campylobacter sp. LR264d]KAA6231580.1 polysaccharide export protein [Campylobacter sp. LR291e]KAA8604665.1 sugar ABC transporter substrate-binding protein [Campylobacter sp. LR185c]